MDGSNVVLPLWLFCMVVFGATIFGGIIGMVAFKSAAERVFQRSMR